MVFFARVLCVLWLFSITGPASAAEGLCDLARVDIRTDLGEVHYAVELADTDATRATGLMRRDSLDRDAGMLFIFDRPRRVAMWMKDTVIPLDMLFVSWRGVITRIHENAIPFDETTIPGGRFVYGVLEVNAGEVAAHGIAVGDVLRHLAFLQWGAAWPCEPAVRDNTIPPLPRPSIALPFTMGTGVASSRYPP